MRKRNIAALICLVLLVAGAVGPRLRWNTSPSMVPTLLWVSDVPPRLGDDVIFCAPERVAELGEKRGYLRRRRIHECATGVTLYKRLVALPGDRVQVHHDVPPRINGVAWGGVPWAFDSRGRQAFVRWTDKWLLPGECYVFGEIPRSFDSRYFGPVPCARLRKVTPIF